MGALEILFIIIIFIIVHVYTLTYDDIRYSYDRHQNEERSCRKRIRDELN